MEKRTILGTFIVFVVLALLAQQMGYLGPAGEIPTAIAKPVETPAISTGEPEVVVTLSNVTLTLAPYDKFVPNAVIDVECTMLSGSGGAVYDSGAVSSTTASVAPGQTYGIYCWDDGQTTNLDGTSITLDASYDWYGYMTNIKIPWRTPVIFPGDFTTNYVGNYKEGSITYYVKDPTDTTNSTSAQYNMSSGDKKNFKVCLEGPSKSSYGNPYAADGGVKMVVGIDYNTAMFDVVKVVDATEAPVPDTNVGVFEKAYYLPFSALVDNQEECFKVRLEVKSTSDVYSTELHDVNIYVYDTAMYFDKTEGHGFKYAVEDTEDDLDIGQGNTWVPIYVS